MRPTRPPSGKVDLFRERLQAIAGLQQLTAEEATKLTNVKQWQVSRWRTAALDGERAQR